MTSSSVARRWGGKDERDRLIEGEQILTAYCNGHQVSEIAERWGYAPSTVHNRIRAALQARIAPKADEYREIVDAAISDQMRKLAEHLDAVDKLILLGMETKDTGLIERALIQRLHTLETRTRVLDRRAKLMGLDAPTKVDATLTVTTPVDTAVAGLLAEMDAGVDGSGAVTVTTAEVDADRS